jgi:hypothetical protein
MKLPQDLVRDTVHLKFRDYPADDERHNCGNANLAGTQAFLGI